MTEAQSNSSNGIVKCPKCGQGNEPGIIRCPQCNSCLRPTFLAIITLLGPILLGLQAIACLAQIADNPINLVPFVISVAGIAILIGLRYGHYWAWIAIQVVWVINIVISIILGLVIDPILLAATAVQVVIIVLLWIYIHSKRVRAFCSVGRPL